MAAGDARQASIAAQRKKKPPVSAPAPVPGVFRPRTVQDILGIKPAPKKPTVPNRAPYRPGYAPEQVDDRKPLQAAPTRPAVRDPRVVAVQTQLRAMGYNVNVDGVMGPQTRAAIAISNNGTVPNAVHHVEAAKSQARRHVAHKAAAETVTAARVSGSHRSPTPFFQGQQPDGYQAVFVGNDGKPVPRGTRPPLGARIHQVPYYLAPHGATGEESSQMSSADLAQAAQYREKEIGLPGVILQDTIAGLVPTRVAHKIEQGQKPSLGDVGSDLLNGALWVSPGAVAPGLRAARAGVTALREEGASRAALTAIREAHGAARTAKEDAETLRKAQAVAKAEQRAEGPVVSPIRDELDQALSQAPNITPKQRKAILEANDVNARAVAHTLGNGTTPEQAYRLMWQGANFHDVDPTLNTVGHVLAQTGHEPEITNVAKTPDTFHENPEALAKASRNLPRNAALREAAPPHAKTPKAMHALLTDLQRRAIEAADYRQWYARSAAGIMAHVGGSTEEADKIAALIAVYSPRAEVYSKSTEWNNLDRALHAYDDFQTEGKISPKWSISSHKEGEGDWQTFRAQQIMEGNFEWEGLKTNRFYRNFLQHIDPEKYKALFGDEKFTTIDTWMRRAFGYPATQKTEERTTLFGTEHVPVGKKQEPITPRMYDFMDRATKAVADSLGWTPEEAQAAIWTSIKAEAEGTPLENAGFDFMDAFAHREARRARPLAPEQIALDTEAATGDVPRKSAVQAAIDASRKPDDGFTLTAGLNPDTGKDGYAVAYGAYEYREAAPLTEKGLLDFRNKHLALLRSDPSLRVGGWHNPDDGQVYLDISRVFPTLDDAMQFAKEQGQLAIFDRSNFDVIPTGLTGEQADSIKSALKEEGRLREQTAKYDDLLDRAFASLSGKPKKALTAAARKDAEQYLFDWAAKNPDGQYEQAFYDLAHDAALGRSARDPDLLFQDDALVQRIGEEHGKPVDKEKILAAHAGDDLADLPKGRRSNKEAQDIAKGYMRDSGLPYTPPKEYAKVDPDRARRIAEWYDQAVDAPHDPEVRAAYDAMARETLEQYRAIQRAGYRFEFYPDGFDPYPSGPSAAIDDLRSNKHMYVFPTDEGFGSLSEAQQAHPLLADSGEKWGGKTVTHNDIFRAVHDFMGHYKEGVGFRAAGEENAWRAHSSMYSPEARRAMTAETRGQNSWVNYGPHGEANRTANQGETVYADQKAVLAPDWVVNEGSGQPLMQEDDLTFPAWWNEDAEQQKAGGGFADLAQQARDWLSDIQWRNMEPEDIEALPDDTALKAVERLYDGGMDQFIADSLPFGDTLPNWLAQASPRVKGAVERTAQGAILHLFRGADTSTALHELAHAVEPLMPEGARNALKAAALEHGAKNYDEFVARSMERYFMEGVAPTKGLRKTFRTLAKAMDDIYGIADRIPGGALDPEIRRVFDTWFAREAKLDPRWARAVGANVLHQAERRDYRITDEDAPDARTLWHREQMNTGDMTIARTNQMLGGTPFHLHAYDENGKLVAAMHGSDQGDRIYAASVYVDPEHRGQGISARMHDMVRRYSETTGKPASATFMNRELGKAEAARSMQAGRAPYSDTRTMETFFQAAEGTHDPKLEAAAMMVDQAGYSVEDAAQMFGVDAGELQAHIDSGAHAAEQARILSNADVGAGEAKTEHDVQHYLGKWLAQTDQPPEEKSLARSYEPVDERTPQEQAREGLRGARRAYKEQGVLRSEERKARFERVAAIRRDPNISPLEKQLKMKAELRGELPKIDFQGFKELNTDALEAMIRHLQGSPYISEMQSLRATDALIEAIGGRVPTPSDLLILEHVFGKDTGVGIAELAKHPWRALIVDALNIPRSLMSTLDLSAPFRQGLVAGARHPVMFFRNFGPMIRAMKSEKYYAEVERAIHEDDAYPLALDGGLALTDFESQLTREERYFSNLAERFSDPITGVRMLTGKAAPGEKLGQKSPIRMSGRAYVTFLNKMRFDMFKYHLRAAQGRGIDINDPEFLRSLSEVINSATGRGGGGEKFERAAGALNTFLFSPRLLKSRLNFLDIRGLYGGGWYGDLHPYARRLALRSFITLGAEAASVIAMFSLVPGVKTMLDPRSADWGKIKFGNTRIDIGGGFQQEIRLAAQLATMTAISSTTGQKTKLDSGKFGQATGLDMFLRFFEGKESPIASIITDKMRGSDAIGNKFQVKREVAQRLIPLLAQDAYDLSRDPSHGGWAAAVAGYGVGMWGFGVQTYGPKDPAKKPTQKLTAQAEQAGVSPPSKDILIAVDHKAHLDSIVHAHTGDRLAQLKDAVKYYQQTTGKHDLDRAYVQAKRAPMLVDTYMNIIRTVLVGPGLSAYEGAVKAAAEAKSHG